MKYSLNHCILLAVLAACLGCLNTNVRADVPTFSWAVRDGGTNREYGSGVAVDSAGNSYVIGKFNGPTTTIGSFVLTNGGIFIAKYDAAGNVGWARQVGPASVTQVAPTGYWVPQVGTDDSGNAYLLGTFYHEVDFGVTNFSTASGGDFFLAKYDSAGNLAWARVAGTYALAEAIAVDATGNSFVTGLCGSDSFGTTNFTASGTTSIFIAKFDTVGNVAWIKGTPGPGTGFNAPKAIVLAATGDYYLCGEFTAPAITFGSFTLTNSGSFDVFVVRYDSADNVVWAKHGGGTNQDSAIGLTTDVTGACYLTGGISSGGSTGSVSFDSCLVNDATFFLVKYGFEGSVIWCRRAGVFAKFSGEVIRSAGDGSGNSYLLGQFFSTATFDGITLTNRGGKVSDFPNYPSYFLAKFNAGGNVVWAKDFGGANSSGHPYEKGSLALDGAGHVAITGLVGITNAIFDDFTISSVGDEDVFVARLDAERPKLDLFPINDSVVISWSTNQPEFILECNANLSATNGWSAVTNAATIAGSQNFVTNSISSGNKFYRLRK